MPKNPQKNEPVARATLDGGQAPVAVYATDGQRLLQAVPGSLAEVAGRLGVSKAGVGFWRSGEKLPGPKARAKMAEVYGIPETAWGTLPGAAKTASQTAAPPPLTYPTSTAPGAPPEPTSTMEAVLQLLARAHAGMNDSSLLEAGRSKWAAEFSKALALKHRLERDAELLEDRIVREHPTFRRIIRTLVETLKPHREASLAVAKVLEGLELSRGDHD